MIIVALGANLPGPAGSPAQTLGQAVRCLSAAGLTVTGQSRLYRSAPVPPSGQPEFRNAVVTVSCPMKQGDPVGLLRVLHRIEADLGRQRRERWEARTLDLDLIDYDGRVMGADQGPPQPGAPARAVPLILPHPRLQDRLFVLLPLRDVAPDWRHPVTGADLEALLQAVPPGQDCTPLDGPWP